MCKIADLIVFVLLVACSVSDWRKKTIPYASLVVLGMAVLALAVLCDATSTRMRISGALMGIMFLLISKCTHEAIGYGDSWILLLLGVHMGLLKVLNVLSVAAVLAAVVSLFFLWKCHWKRQATLPFVPFLTVSYLGVILL